MTTTCIRHTELPNTSRLFADLVYHFDRVSSFYAHAPYDPASFAAAARQIQYPAGRRAAMVAALAEQNPGNPSLEILAREGAVAVGLRLGHAGLCDCDGELGLGGLRLCEGGGGRNAGHCA